MDVALVPVAEDGPAAFAAAGEQAVRIFSDPERDVLPGSPVAAGPHLQRLRFPRFPAAFPLAVPGPGFYALFTQHHPDEFTAAVYRGGEALAPGCSRAFAPDHEHDEEVASVGLSLPGEVDGRKLNDWISELLRVKGNDIFRCKGVLALQGKDQRLVFQGVHMLFDAKLDRPWGAEPRRNTFVFIGRNLDRDALVSGFRACLV
jgi:hypothetical protein